MHPDLSAFITAKSAAGLSAKSLRWYSMFIGQYLRWSNEQSLDNKEPETIEAFLAHLRHESKSAFTVSGCYRALRVFFKWMVQRRRTPSNPLTEIQPPTTPKKRKRHVKDHEFRQLYNSIVGDTWTDERDRCIFLVLYYSGLRASELASLRVEDVDRVRMVLRVNAGKGDKDRDVPFIPDLLPHLDAYLEMRPATRHGWLFVAQSGNQCKTGHLAYEGLKEIMRRRCAAAGMPRLGLHSFRHGYAMQFLNAGMDIGVLAQSLGHASIETTRRFYAEWQTQEMSRQYTAALDRLGPPPKPDVS